MKQWEYLVVKKRGLLLGSGKLTRIGADGWELVTVTEAYGTLTGKSETPVRYFIFKRQVED